MTTEVFHPDLRRTARFLPRAAVGPRSLPLVRALTKVLPDRHTGVEVHRLETGGSARIFRPEGQDTLGPGLLWIHGGGYVIGRAQFDDRLCRRFSRELGATVISVDYRLAPEHPYPAALDDCYAALTMLADMPGVDAARLAIGGASAGGGLAAALAQRAHDLGAVEPIFQLLVYPMLDDRPHVGRQDNYRLWNRDSNRFGWEAYRGGADPNVAVPARRDDLSGLPPAWIGVGALDLFHDEDVEYATRLERAGVSCVVDVVPGAFHGFDLVAPRAPISRRFFDIQCDRLRAALAATN
ncbi:alpha/beta hydrolase [Aldersonia sp. NBC_00410]|uniref:alpha/beta hydrolase n=1 Tax=Aldersonia sp. NBC_00410 TaxID=2975954 RepID=UPI0022581C22|nr:alpha/beta hydrolase [Aldersonia sp. NBC_00410]MCX5045393.1 alpha/beta hydrolase [Aldersonia sp. NBC_00410]